MSSDHLEREFELRGTLGALPSPGFGVLEAWTCLRCGAVVASEDREAHRDWHGTEVEPPIERMDMKKIRKQIEVVREHLALSDRAGGNEQELRELRAAVSTLANTVERLADR